MKKIFSVILETLIMAGILFGLLEITLRVSPSLIPPSLLINFQKDIREEIAARKGLARLSETVFIDRADNGPPLRIYRPSSTLSMPFDQDDEGAIRESIKLDEQGFCNPEESPQPHYDLVALGDSFTWCVGVKPEDSWVGKFAALSGYSAYSLGVGGTGPYEYVELLKKFGLAKSPKVVVMNIYAGNDLRSAISFHEYRAALAERGGKEHLVAPCVGLPYPACFIFRSVKEGFIGRKSYAFNLIANGTRETIIGIRRRFSSAPEVKEPNFRYRAMLAGGEKLFNRGNFDVDDLEYAERLRRGEIKLDAFDEALTAFAELSQKHGFRPIVSFTPAAYSAYEDYVKFEDPKAGELIQWFSDEERKYLKAKSQELGYEFLDFTLALQAAAGRSGELLYFPVNVHLTKTGHAVIAEVLAEFIKAAKILP